MITTYPHFSPINLEDQHAIQEFTGRFLPYSDFNFTSMFCWNTDGTTEVALLNGNLVVRMPDYLDGHPVYSLLGNQEVDASLATLLADTKKLVFVPEPVVESLVDPTPYDITEDTINFDYVYDLNHLSDLPGADFKKKRNKHNIFVNDHAHLELRVNEATTIDETRVEAIRKLDRQWADASSREMGDILSERKALDMLLDNAASFKLVVTEVWVEGEMKAFSINEVLAHDFAICHFEKALKAHHENLNTFLVIEAAKRLRAAGCKWVNWEQDLGLEGLRRSKRSYQPVSMLKKYVITKR